jgi:hypothetical protein
MRENHKRAASFIALGAGAGIILGAALGNPGVGMVVGAALGLVLGRLPGRVDL